MITNVMTFWIELPNKLGNLLTFSWKNTFSVFRGKENPIHYPSLWPPNVIYSERWIDFGKSRERFKRERETCLVFLNMKFCETAFLRF